MTKKEQIDLNLELRADKRLYGRLKTLRRYYQEKRDKVMEQRRERVEQMLGDYPTEQEAHEAYGYDMISEDEYTQILEAIEKGHQVVEAESEESIISAWLDMWICALDHDINELTYQLMTPEEKASHDKSVQEWKDHVEELRKKHGR